MKGLSLGIGVDLSRFGGSADSVPYGQIRPPLFSNSQSFYAPTVSFAALAASLLTNTQTFYAPTVTGGASYIWEDAWTAGTLPSGVAASGGANRCAVQSDGYWAADTAPRFHYDYDTLQCLGVYTEGARTNLALQSNDLATTWTTTSSTVTANAATGPFGASSADRIEDQNLGSSGTALIAQTITVSTSTAYAASTIVKKGTYSNAFNWGAGINHTNFTTPPSGTSYFDINTPAIGTMNTGCTGYQRAYGGSYYRNSVTYTSDGTDTSGSLRLNLCEADGDNTFTRDGTHDVLCAHVQLEAVTSSRVFPSTPIITTTGSVAATADSITRTGADFSTGWSSTAGRITVSARLPYTVGTQVLWCARKSSDATNYYIVVYVTGATVKLKIVSGGVTQCDVGTATITANTDFDVAASWTANSFSISVDGGTAETDTSGSVPAGLNELLYGTDGTDPMFGIMRGTWRYYDSAA